ncbi:UDP binding domain-containing protein [Pseudomonas sp. DSP3-2-2]|uniref:UDP binding domain-containing protein n=1 Tax=unclassified Pseudomonas TaxID=196821 RepID=UPI003CEA291C
MRLRGFFAVQYSYAIQTRQLRLHGSLYSCVEGADAVVLVTDLKQFRQPDLARIRALMRMPVLFDGRNIYDFAELSAQGFLYHGIGTASGGAL